jgi:polyhydroxybutyrate depolymerase
MPGRGGRLGRALWRASGGGLAAAVVIGATLGPAGPAIGAGVAGPPPPGAPPGRMPLFTGCGQPPPAVAPNSVAVDGRRWGLITVVPAGYRSDVPQRLVIAFHGRTSSNIVARRYFGLERAAADATIFVYPSGLRRKDGSYSWSAPGGPTEQSPDLALFDALVAKLTGLYCIDRKQIFAVGHSLGAWYANSLGCARGDVLRGIGTIAGALDRFQCQGGVAAVLFHNPRDRRVGYRYGLLARDWLRAENGDAKHAQPVSLDGFQCQRYGGAGARNPVLWCPYATNRTATGLYYPHHWPDGAARAIMDFFASLPAGPGMPAARPVAAGSGGSESRTR